MTDKYVQLADNLPDTIPGIDMGGYTPDFMKKKPENKNENIQGAELEEYNQLYSQFVEQHETSSNKPGYNPYQIPPNLEICKKHRIANSFGRKEGNDEKCPCCLRYTSVVPFKQSDSVDLFSARGPGYALYFKLLCMGAILLVFPFMVLASYNLLNYYNGSNCIVVVPNASPQGSSAKSASKRILSQANIDQNQVDLMQQSEGISEQYNHFMAVYKQHKVEKQSKETGAVELRGVADESYIRSYLETMCQSVIRYIDDDCSKYNKFECSHNPNSDICRQIIRKKMINLNKQNQCIWTTQTSLSLGNQNFSKEDFKSSDLFLTNDFYCVLVALGLLNIFKAYHIYLARKYDAMNDTLEDFTVVLQGLPSFSGQNAVEDLEEAISKCLAEKGVKVRQLSFVYDTNYMRKQTVSYETMQKGKMAIASSQIDKKQARDDPEAYRKSQKKLNKEVHDDDFKLTINDLKQVRKLKEITEALPQFKEQIMKDQENYMKSASYHDHFKHQAFVVLDKQGQPGILLKNKEGLTLKFHDEEFSLTVEEALEPTDVNWDNLGYGKCSRFCRGSVSAALSIFVIVFMFFFFMWLEKYNAEKQKESKNPDNDKSWFSEFYLSISLQLMGFIIQFSNKILETILTWLIKFRKPKSLTEEHLYTASNLYKIQFMITGITPLCVSILFFNYFNQGGLIEKMDNIFIAGVIYPPILSMQADPEPEKRKKIRDEIADCAKAKPGAKKFTQAEANWLYQKQDWWISYKYATLFRNLALAFFYMPIMPMAIVYGFASICITYYTEKILLITRSNSFQRVGSIISFKMLSEFEFCFILFGLGKILKDFIYASSHLQTFVVHQDGVAICIVSIIAYFVPLDRLYECCVPQVEEQGPELTYDEIMKLVAQDYPLTNPCTSKFIRNARRAKL